MKKAEKVDISAISGSVVSVSEDGRYERLFNLNT